MIIFSAVRCLYIPTKCNFNAKAVLGYSLGSNFIFELCLNIKFVPTFSIAAYTQKGDALF